jgi:MFS family permease
VESWLQDLLPKESRGRFYGLINITSAIGVGLGAVISGFLADKYSIFWIFVASAIILWCSLPFFFRVPETLKKSDKSLPPSIQK